MTQEWPLVSSRRMTSIAKSTSPACPSKANNQWLWVIIERSALKSEGGGIRGKGRCITYYFFFSDPRGCVYVGCEKVESQVHHRLNE